MAKKLSFSFLSILLCGVMLLMSGCSAISQLQDESISLDDLVSSIQADIFGEHDQVCSTVVVSLPRHSGYHPIEDKTAYDTLSTDAQREAYASIEESLFNITNEPGGSYGRYALKRAYIPDLTSGEIFMVKEAVIADHPEAFWINGTYSLGQNMHDGNYLVMYTNFDYTSITDRVKALEQAVASLLKEIPGDISEYDRELIIHDCLVRDTSYDEEAADLADYSYLDAATVYGALVNKKALCGGYSYAVKLLLNRVGVSSSTVKGISKNVGHMWNLVRVDDEWYHLDVTWDDPIILSAETLSRYDYFNVTDDIITIDHEISENYSALTEELIIKQGGKGMNFFNFDMPECTSLEANYYILNALDIGSLDDRGATLITDRMKGCCSNGDTTFFVYFSSMPPADETAAWLDGTLVSAMSAANRSGIGRRISQCLRSSRDNDSSAWSSVYCIRIVYEEPAE